MHVQHLILSQWTDRPAPRPHLAFERYETWNNATLPLDESTDGNDEEMTTSRNVERAGLVSVDARGSVADSNMPEAVGTDASVRDPRPSGSNGKDGIPEALLSGSREQGDDTGVSGAITSSSDSLRSKGHDYRPYSGRRATSTPPSSSLDQPESEPAASGESADFMVNDVDVDVNGSMVKGHLHTGGDSVPAQTRGVKNPIRRSDSRSSSREEGRGWFGKIFPRRRTSGRRRRSRDPRR